MKKSALLAIRLLFLINIFTTTQAFAFDSRSCFSMLSLASSHQTLGQIGKNLNDLGMQLTEEATRTNNFSQGHLLAPIALTGSGAMLSSIVIFEFIQLARSDMLTKEPEMFGKMFQAIAATLTMPHSINELFLKTVADSIRSAPTNNHKKILTEVYTNISNINTLIGACK